MVNTASQFDQIVFDGKSPAEAGALLWSLGPQNLESLTCIVLLLIDHRVRNHELYNLIKPKVGQKLVLNVGYLSDCGCPSDEAPFKFIERVLKVYEAAAGIKSLRKAAELGDVLAIPLQNGQYAFAHFGAMSKEFGALFWIYGCSSTCEFDQLKAPLLFGPIRFNYVHAVRNSIYPIVAVKIDIPYPRDVQFVGWNPGPTESRYYVLHTEFGETDIGKNLPEKYFGIERDQWWSLKYLEERIVTGINPFSVP